MSARKYRFVVYLCSSGNEDCWKRNAKSRWTRIGKLKIYQMLLISSKTSPKWRPELFLNWRLKSKIMGGLGGAGLSRSWRSTLLHVPALGSSDFCQNLDAGNRSKQTVPYRSVATQCGRTMVETEGHDSTITSVGRWLVRIPLLASDFYFPGISFSYLSLLRL